MNRKKKTSSLDKKGSKTNEITKKNYDSNHIKYLPTLEAQGNPSFLLSPYKTLLNIDITF